MHWYKSLFFFTILICSCQSDTEQPKTGNIVIAASNQPQFELVSPASSGVDFNNLVKEDEQFHHLMWESVYNGGGTAVGDLNNDGLPDIYFTGNQVKDALYINKGDLKFEDISKSSGIAALDGWSSGVTMVDINADGWLDIYVCKMWWDLDRNNVEGRRNKLFINNKDLTFTESAKQYGLDDAGHSTQATFIDFDQDGDLDAYVVNAPSNNFKQKLEYIKNDKIPYQFSDHFYQNMGKNKFLDRTKEVGVENYSFGLGVVSTDINQDGWTDIYVACDFEKPDLLFLNNQNGTFTNQGNNKFKHTSFSSMGCDIADFNNDCLPEIAVLDMQAEDHKRAKTNMRAMSTKAFWNNVSQGNGFQYMSNALQLNNGWGYFSEIGQMAGLAGTDWSWSILMNDFDNDGYKDIFVTNGVNRDMRNSDLVESMKNAPESEKRPDRLFELAMSFPSEKVPNYMFQNDGQLHLENVTQNWGLEYPGFSFGSAYADLDLDGDLELIVCNSNEPVHIFKNNNSKGHHHLQIEIKGPPLNRTGLGTKAIVYLGEEQLYQELTLTRGFQSSSTSILQFGLGQNTTADSIAVIFPDRKVFKAKAVKADQKIVVEHRKANHKFQTTPSDRPIFQEATKKVNLSFRHQENVFDDFAREILLPHRQSQNGPFLSSGDVNKDGRADVFIGNAAGKSGDLFLQKADGTFQPAPSKPWTAHQKSEDMGSLFFDSDDDGDLDLYVVSGGSEAKAQSSIYKDRLYQNDGKGNFSFAPNALPKVYANGSCARAADFDGDGDLDLFVGGRGVPGKYPHAGQSQLLINDQGQFSNKIEDLATGLERTGMVTDAVWEDYNKDGKVDLIVVGEWMQPTFYKNENGQLNKDVQAISTDMTGWWFDLNATDIDEDGDLDFVLGNIGLNNKYKASEKKSLMVYSNDFDQNNTNDIVLAKQSPYGQVPVRGRECSSEQMPFIAQKFKNFDSFANASMKDIYGDALDQSLAYEAKEFRSGLLINDGNGHFSFSAFPNLAQISPVMGTVVYDFNKDGKQDVLLAGNHFDAEVETVRHDAGNGLLLLGGKNLTFTEKPCIKSGFYAPLNVKDLMMIPSVQGKAMVIVANNNSDMRSFIFKE